MRKTSAFLEPMFAVASVLSPTFWSDGDVMFVTMRHCPQLACPTWAVYKCDCVSQFLG